MKAAVIREHGPLDCVHIEDVPAPEPAAGEVLIEVRSAGLNHLDIWVRKGREGLQLKMPHILGSDAAGVVIAVGPGVVGVKQGDEVVINPGLSCGRCEYCRRGQQSQCVSFGIVGMSRPGTFAEFVAVPAANVHRKPAHLTWDQAGAFVLPYLTAWRMLFTRGRLAAGQTVLIHGIGGGVALSALQLAKLTGAETIVTSSSDDKLARATKIGADHTINYKTADDVTECVMDLTDGRGVDLVIDTVGAATWPVDFAAVRRGGRIVICGITTGPQAQTNLQALYWNQLTVIGSTMGSDEDFRCMIRAVTTTGLTPVMDVVEALSSIQEAMGRMEAAEQFGKIALHISG